MWRRFFGGILRSRDTAQARPAPAATPPPRRDWATLPPLDTRGHQSFGLASGIDRFSRSLVQRHAAVRHLEPLGHEVVRHAPRGVVTGLARAVEAVPEHGPVLDQPFRKRTERQRRGPWRRVLRWASPEAAASPPPPEAPPARGPAPPPVSRSAAPDASPSTGFASPEVGTSLPLAALPSSEPPAPDQDPAPREDGARRPDGTGVTAGGEREAPPPRPLVHPGPRILRSVAPSRPGRAPSSHAPRPLDLPLRPLAVQRAAATDPAADDHAAGLPPTPSGTATEGRDQPALGTPDGSDRVETAPPTETPGPDGQPPPDVRPTIGAPGTTPPTGTPPQVPPTTGGDVPSHARTRPGLGSPLDSLPPTARRVHSSTDPATSRTAQGRDVAMQRGLQRSSPAAPSPPAADPSARPSGGDRGPAPARPRPDLPLPPVVARRVEPAVTAAEPEPDAPDGDESPAPVLPLASLRQPISGSAPAPGDIDDVGPTDGWWRPDRAPGPAGPGSPARPGSRRGPEGGTSSGHRTIGGPLHRSAEASDSSPAVPVRWRTPTEVEPRDPGPGVSGSRSPRGRRADPSSGRSGPAGEARILAHEGVGPGPSRRADGSRSDQAVPTRVDSGSHPSRPVLRSLSGPTESNSGWSSSRGLAELPSDALDVPLVRNFVGSRGGRSGGSSRASTKPDMPLAAQVQREHAERPRATTTSHSEPPPVQRQEAQEAPTAALPDVQPASGGGDVDREQLFRELYPRVRDELRWELRVQRERAGLLADPL